MNSKIIGWWGEKKIALRLWLSLNNEIYHRFNNIILKSKNGTTQIDHLIISIYGVFIVETKNRKGLIYGSPSQPKWTQVYFKQKYLFQNPIYQTFRQKKILMELFQLDDTKVKTIVFFTGKCTIKTCMQENVLQSGLTKYIKRFEQKIFTQMEVENLINSINEYLSNNKIKSSEHINSLYIRHNSKSICPRCGSMLVERTAKNGINAGTKFLGCDNYPKCKFTREL